MSGIENLKSDDADRTSEHQAEAEPNDMSTTECVLYNPVVLDAIFDYLDKWEWKVVRLVNKTWFTTLQPRWRDEMWYTWTSRDFETFDVEFLKQQHPENNANDLLQLCHHPIRNISIYDARGRGQEYENVKLIILLPDQTRFWELYGHGLQRLHLEGVRIHEVALLKKLLFELTPSLEEFSYWLCACDDLEKQELNTLTSYTTPDKLQRNLKCLELFTAVVIKDDQFDIYKFRFPMSWIELFSRFPNIQTFKLRTDNVKTKKPSDISKLFEAVDIIRKANNNQVLNITKLETDTTLRSDELICLVQTFKPGLRQLALVPEPFSEALRQLPKDMMPQGITKLTVHGCFYTSLEFMLYTPNLEELDVEEIPCILPSDVNLAYVAPLANLKKLKYTMNKCVIREKEMEILVRLIPNVKICDLFVDGVDADGFQTLCVGWVNLEHLNLPLEFFDENILIENLIHLKCLKSLEINETKSLVNVLISDKSVFEGFLKMPSITKIDFPWSSEITDEGLKALEGKISNDLVEAVREYRNYQYYVD